MKSPPASPTTILNKSLKSGFSNFLVKDITDISLLNANPVKSHLKPQATACNIGRSNPDAILSKPAEINANADNIINGAYTVPNPENTATARIPIIASPNIIRKAPSPTSNIISPSPNLWINQQIATSHPTMEVNLHFMHRSNFTGEDRIPYDTHYLPVARPSGSICCAKRLSCRLVVQCEVRKDSAVDQVTNDIVLSQRSQLSGIATFQLSLGSAYIGLQARYLLWANALQVQINGAPLPF